MEKSQVSGTVMGEALIPKINMGSPFWKADIICPVRPPMLFEGYCNFCIDFCIAWFDGCND